MQEFLSDQGQEKEKDEQGETLQKARLVIFSDVDGTFLEPGVSKDVVKEALGKIGHNGIVVLNSSWSTDGLQRLQSEYGFSGPVIGENGGEI